jgi:hypothetical protein
MSGRAGAGAVNTIAGAVFDVPLRHLRAKESKQGDCLADMIAQLKRTPDNKYGYRTEALV